MGVGRVGGGEGSQGGQAGEGFCGEEGKGGTGRMMGEAEGRGEGYGGVLVQGMRAVLSPCSRGGNDVLSNLDLAPIPLIFLVSTRIFEKRRRKLFKRLLSWWRTRRWRACRTCGTRVTARE